MKLMRNGINLNLKSWLETSQPKTGHSWEWISVYLFKSWVVSPHIVKRTNNSNQLHSFPRGEKQIGNGVSSWKVLIKGCALQGEAFFNNGIVSARRIYALTRGREVHTFQILKCHPNTGQKAICQTKTIICNTLCKLWPLGNKILSLHCCHNL